jgi:hypothetical protein
VLDGDLPRRGGAQVCLPRRIRDLLPHAGRNRIVAPFRGCAPSRRRVSPATQSKRATDGNRIGSATRSRVYPIPASPW